MGGPQVEVDPAEVGFDKARLERIDRHFARYVDTGRLPGWLITVSRHGKLAHVAICGHRVHPPARHVSQARKPAVFESGNSPASGDPDSATIIFE